MKRPTEFWVLFIEKEHDMRWIDKHGVPPPEPLMVQADFETLEEARARAKDTGGNVYNRSNIFPADPMSLTWNFDFELVESYS